MTKLLWVLIPILLIAGCESVTNPEVPIGATRQTAAPIGTPVETHARGTIVWGDGRLRITVLEVVRGEAANQMVAAANQFNHPPGPGMEYLLARIRIEALSVDDPDEPHDINFTRFEAVSGSGVVYESPFGLVDPAPQLWTELYGGEHTGWATFEVARYDPAPVMAFDRNDPHRRWFRLH